VISLVRDPFNYPIGLTFARPMKTSDETSRWSSIVGAAAAATADAEDTGIKDDEAETICVTADEPELLGCIFDNAERPTSDVVVTDFLSIRGFFQRVMSKAVYEQHDGFFNLAIESVNGEFVPSYASKEMMKNVLKRSWTKHHRVEILFCDDERKSYVHSLLMNNK